MRRLIPIAFTGILVCILFAPAAFADEKGCTLASVKGTYGYVGFGAVLATNPFGAPAGTYSSTGTLTFDGKGNLLIVDTGRTDNLFSLPDTPSASTYTITEQCVVTITEQAFVDAGLPGPHFKGVLVNGGKELRAISLVPGYIVNYVNTAKITVEDKDEDKD